MKVVVIADNPRVLLVDPDESARVLTARVLLAGGCEIAASVPNYAQALVSARRERPTVVVTDLLGGQVLTPPLYVESLRRHTPAPIIIHAATADLPAPGDAKQWGCWAVMDKGRRGDLLGAVWQAHRAGSEHGR